MRRATLIALLMIVTSAVYLWEPTDEFTRYFEDLLKNGPPYRNCGRVILGGNRDQADNCVLQAFAAKQPFFVLYDKLGVDSDVADGLVLSERKQLTVVLFDDMSCSIPHCAQVDACGAPTITRTNDGLHVKCVNEYGPHAGACLSTKYTYSNYSVHVQCVNEYDP